MKTFSPIILTLFIFLYSESDGQIPADTTKSGKNIMATPSQSYYDQLKAALDSSDCFCNSVTPHFRIAIQEDGTISSVEQIIETKTCWDDEMRKIIVTSSPWKPTLKDGEAIESMISLPIVIGTVFTYPCDEIAGDSIYELVDEMPQQPEGFHRYMIDLAHCIENDHGSPPSKVHLEFIISSDGSVRRCEIIRPEGFNLSIPCEASLLSMPKWTPGRKEAEEVTVRVTVPLQINWR